MNLSESHPGENQTAFTWIELLVLIATIAILSGLLLPALMNLSATPVQGPGSDPPATAWLTSRADDQGFRFHSEWRGTGEGDGILIVEVMRGGDLSQSARVYFATRDGTARAGEDYEAQAGILTFAPGEARKSISLSILNDARKDTSENFVVELSDPSPGTRLASPDQLTVTIEDDDLGVQFIRLGRSVRSGEGAELVNEDAGAIHLLIARQDDLPGPVAVGYATIDGTARAGEDYTAVTGILTFEHGRQDLFLTVPILNDGLREGDEAFSVELSSASPDMILGWVTSVAVTILDNDAGIRFVRETNSVLETAGVATVRVLRGNDGPGPISVRYATTDGTALEGREYMGVSGTLTFSGDDTEIRVPLLSDEAAEPAKSFQVTLSDPTGGALGAVTNTVIEILDADTPVISAEDVWVPESAGAAEVVVRRRLGEKHGVVVGYTTARPPSLSYQLGKWARRHRVAFGIASVVAAAVLAVATMAIISAQEERAIAARLQGALAREYLHRGQALCERGEVAAGLHWLVRGLEEAPSSSTKLRHVVEENLAAWSRQWVEAEAVLFHESVVFWLHQQWLMDLID